MRTSATSKTVASKIVARLLSILCIITLMLCIINPVEVKASKNKEKTVIELKYTNIILSNKESIKIHLYKNTYTNNVIPIKSSKISKTKLKLRNNNGILKINRNGKIKALKAGDEMVDIAYKNKTYSCMVHVMSVDETNKLKLLTSFKDVETKDTRDKDLKFRIKMYTPAKSNKLESYPYSLNTRVVYKNGTKGAEFIQFYNTAYTYDKISLYGGRIVAKTLNKYYNNKASDVKNLNKIPHSYVFYYKGKTIPVAIINHSNSNNTKHCVLVNSKISSSKTKDFKKIILRSDTDNLDYENILEYVKMAGSISY